MKTFYFAKTKIDRVFKETGAVTFKPGRWKWVANVAWRVLNRLRALEPFYHPLETYSYTPDLQMKVTDAIIKHAENIRSKSDLARAVAIMGAADFQELTHIHLTDRTSLLTGEIRVSENNNGKIMTTYRNIPIQVIPNLKGVAVILRD